MKNFSLSNNQMRLLKRVNGLFIAAPVKTCFIGLIGVLLCVSLAGAAEKQGSKTNTKLDMLNHVGIDQHLNAQVPLQLRFNDAQGKSVELSELLDGKPVILNLAYFRCPMLCNRTRDGIVRTLRTLELSAGEEFKVITVSFDPQETPKLAADVKRMTLAQYDRPGSENGWHFLSGKEENIARLAESVGFRFAWDERTARYAHAAGIIILTPDGRVSRYLNGVEFTARDLRLSLVEASAGEIGSPTDQVLLLCYQYDPSRGKYGLAIMNIIRLSGLLTVVGLLAGFVVLMRRERRSARKMDSFIAESTPSQDSNSNSQP